MTSKKTVPNACWDQADRVSNALRIGRLAVASLTANKDRTGVIIRASGGSVVTVHKTGRIIVQGTDQERVRSLLRLPALKPTRGGQAFAAEQAVSNRRLERENAQLRAAVRLLSEPITTGR